MRHVLHLFTRPPDSFVHQLLRNQEHLAVGETQVTIIDLTAADADYSQVVQLLFSADSVISW